MVAVRPEGLLSILLAISLVLRMVEAVGLRQELFSSLLPIQAEIGAKRFFIAFVVVPRHSEVWYSI
jgi:hypothetical protein